MRKIQGPRLSGSRGAIRDNSGCLIPFGALFAIAGAGTALSTLLQGPRPGRDALLRLMLSVVFACVGTIVIIWGAAGRKTARRLQTLVAQNPDKPWLWRDDWASGFAEPETSHVVLSYGLMGVVFLLITSPVLVNLKRELGRHNYLFLLALLFPGAGALLIGQALLGRLRERRFGARFHLAETLGLTGGHLRGRIETKFALPPDQAVDLTLSCVRSYLSSSGSSRARLEEIRWQDKAAVAATAGPLGSSIPVDFEIPFDIPPTDSQNPDDQTLWRLTAARKLPGVDFKISFQVPVFRTAASDSSITAAMLEQKDVAHAGSAQPAGSKIRVSATPSGALQFYLGPARTKGAAAIVTIFGLGFLGAGFFFNSVVSRSFGRVLGSIPLIVAGVTGLALVAIGISLWQGTVTLTIENGGLRIRSAFLGLARTRMVRAGEIQRFELYPGLQSGNQVWYDLRIHRNGGGTITAGSGLEKREAEWLEAQLRKNLGIS